MKKPSVPVWTTVHPVFGPHMAQGIDCWCEPIVLLPCPECDGRQSWLCWCCGGRGQIVCEKPEMYDGPCAFVIVHADEGCEKAVLQ